MIKAIHKGTGKLVSAFKLLKDGEWFGKEREEWISPHPEVENWKELKKKGINEVDVSFIVPHKRKQGKEFIFVKAHFRINNPEAIPNKLNESEEHLLSKEGIYEALLDGEIKINGKEIKELGEIEDIDIEHKLSSSRNSKIVDVFLKFKKESNIYGNGIVFEIQFSNQNSERTEERTYDRILSGASVCWLWEGDFKGNRLINKDVEVIPFLKALEDFKDSNRLKWIKEMNSFSRVFSSKMEEIKGKINDYEDEFDTKIDNQINFFLQEKEKINSLVNKETFGINEKVQNISENTINTMKEQKEKILRDILDDQLIINKIKEGLDYERISSGIKVEIVNQIKEGVLSLMETEMKKKSGEFDIQEILQKTYHDAKKEYLKMIGKEYEKFDGLFHKCPRCENKSRIESSKILGEEIVCGTCFMKSLQVKEEEKDGGR